MNPWGQQFCWFEQVRTRCCRILTTISLLAMPPKSKKQSTVNGTTRERVMLKRSSRSVSSLSVLSMSLSEDGDVAHKDGRQDVSNTFENLETYVYCM